MKVPSRLELGHFNFRAETKLTIHIIFPIFFRIDTGDDNRVSKEEFTSDKIKASLEKWVGPIEDLEAEFDSIDTNSGGQVTKTNIICNLVSLRLLSF